MAADNYDRFRSFTERYVIARAPLFAKGTERDEAWAAMLDARTMYKQMAGLSEQFNADEAAAQALQMTNMANTLQAAKSIMQTPGLVTGATGCAGPAVPAAQHYAGAGGASAPARSWSLFKKR